MHRRLQYPRYAVPSDTCALLCFRGGQAEYSFDLGGPSAAHQTFTFHANAEVLPLSIERPLGIVFEEKEVDGVKLCVAVEVLEGSNAAAAGVNVGDVLKCTTAVFTVKGKVSPPPLPLACPLS